MEDSRLHKLGNSVSWQISVEPTLVYQGKRLPISVMAMPDLSLI